MDLEKSKYELQKEYGLPGATAVLVIHTIENEKINGVDLLLITELWNKIYKELSFKNSTPNNGSVLKAFAGLIFQGNVKFRHEISIKEWYTLGKNYKYVKTAISILKSDYDNTWPNELKIPELWSQVFIKLNKREIAHNSQLHVLKALVESGRIRGFNYK
jgi:hypothetical protein